jgi:hypothetical protein
MYDEYSQTDYMQDVSCDTSIAELLEEMMPFPWDDRGRYTCAEDLVVAFRIDDGVSMPRVYEVDPSWQLLETFRRPEYQMPLLLPVFHVVPKGSDVLQQWGLHELSSTAV